MFTTGGSASSLQERIDWFRRELARPRSAHAPAQRRTLLDWLAFDLLMSGDIEEPRRILAETGTEGMQAHRALLMFTGVWEELEEEYLDRVNRNDPTGNLFVQLTSLMNLGQLYVLRGELDAAERVLRQVVAVVGDHEHPAQAQALFTLASLAAADGQVVEGSAYLADADPAVIHIWPSFSLQSEYHRATAMVAAAQGDLDAAQRAFTDSVTLVAEQPVRRAQTLHWWGQTLLRHGRTADAREKFEEAIAVLREIGYAERYIDTIERERDAAR